MSGSVRKLFEETRDRYDEIYERFLEFHFSPIGGEHQDTLGDFIHGTNRLAQKVGRALLKGTLPKRGEISTAWRDHDALTTAMGIMELILEMDEQCHTK